MNNYMGSCVIKKILKYYNGQLFISSKSTGNNTGTQIVFTFDLQFVSPESGSGNIPLTNVPSEFPYFAVSHNHVKIEIDENNMSDIEEENKIHL